MMRVDWRPDALNQSLLSNPVRGTLLVVHLQRQWLRYRWDIVVDGASVASGKTSSVELAQQRVEEMFLLRMGVKT